MSRTPKPGFTLVEMLVVIGIIAILAALLTPAVSMAIRTTRNAAIAVEINQLATAIESYKQDKGDYPPNIRGTPTNPLDASVFLRHVRKCYPKIDPREIDAIIDLSASPPTFRTSFQLDEGESLVFWLSMTRDDPRFPFGFATAAPASAAFKKYYDFEATRMIDGGDTDVIPSYVAKYCQDTFYVYIDSRSYGALCRFQSDGAPSTAKAEDTNFVRPYWSDTIANSAATIEREKYKPVNPTTFQILCAGQDGEFGDVTAMTTVKGFPSGTNYETADKDNITNFSAGKTLADNIP